MDTLLEGTFLIGIFVGVVGAGVLICHGIGLLYLRVRDWLICKMIGM